MSAKICQVYMTGAKRLQDELGEEGKVKIRNVPLLLLHGLVSDFDTLFAESPATLFPVRVLRLPALYRGNKTFHMGRAAEEKIHVATSGHAKLTVNKGVPC